MSKLVKGDAHKQNIYNFLVAYKSAHDGCSPGIREISIGAKCAPMTTQKYLTEMERDGILVVGVVRGIRLVGSKWIAPERK